MKPASSSRKLAILPRTGRSCLLNAKYKRKIKNPDKPTKAKTDRILIHCDSQTIIRRVAKPIAVAITRNGGRPKSRTNDISKSERFFMALYDKVSGNPSISSAHELYKRFSPNFNLNVSKNETGMVIKKETSDER